MTREQMLEKLNAMANEVMENEAADEDKMWRACEDWNSEHYTENAIEIHEIWDDDDELIGFGIEDSAYYYAR